MVSNRQPRNRKSSPRDNNRLVGGVLVVGVLVFAAVGVLVLAAAADGGGGGGAATVGDVVATTVGVVLGAAGVVLAGVGAAGYVLANRRTSGRRQRDTGPVALRLATWLLPSEARQDYAEEWRRWLLELREAGEPRYRRLIELLTILLVAAPHLAVILRLGRRRAMD